MVQNKNWWQSTEQDGASLQACLKNEVEIENCVFVHCSLTQNETISLLDIKKYCVKWNK